MKFLLFVTWLIVSSKRFSNFRSSLFCRGINKKLPEIYDTTLSQIINLCFACCVIQMYKKNTFEISVVEDVIFLNEALRSSSEKFCRVSRNTAVTKHIFRIAALEIIHFRCLLVSSTTFFWTVFSKNTSGRLLLNFWIH